MSDAGKGTEELKNILKGKQFVFGPNQALKLLKQAAVETVLVVSDCPKGLAKQLDYYASLSKAKVVFLDISSDEAGATMKRAHPITIISILKGR
ncbi:ribosomal L7Ae/L30e/S12e/Gadd45 family protein [archaeon]|nr:ribosomal L7Ae/L30e/S12e/Gadd45 family protein [archaeon]